MAPQPTRGERHGAELDGERERGVLAVMEADLQPLAVYNERAAGALSAQGTLGRALQGGDGMGKGGAKAGDLSGQGEGR